MTATQSPDKTNLRKCLKRLREAILEQAKVETAAAEAQAEIDKVLENGRIDDEKEQKRLMNARLILDLCPGRRKFLTAELPHLESELRQELKEVARQHDRLVSAHRLAKRAEFVEALKPYWPDLPARKLDRLVDELSPPSPALDFSRDFQQHTNWFPPPTGQQLVEAAEQLIAFSLKVGRKFGWTDSAA